MRENGIANKIAKNYFKPARPCIYVNKISRRRSRLSFADMSSPFVILGMGMSIAFITFVCELLSNYYNPTTFLRIKDFIIIHFFTSIPRRCMKHTRSLLGHICKIKSRSLDILLRIIYIIRNFFNAAITKILSVYARCVDSKIGRNCSFITKLKAQE